MNDFLLRSLRYHWRISIAVLLAAAVATAVLTGALLMGDSVRGSLRDLVLDRLGKIDYAIFSTTFFREELSDQLDYDHAAPAVVLTGTAIQADTKSRASGVQIYGIDERFVDMFPFNSAEQKKQIVAFLQNEANQIFPSLIINETLQKELHTKAGDQIMLTFEGPHSIHRESVLGTRDPDESVKSIRLEVRTILPDTGMGRFGLRPNQNLPSNAFVALPVIQKALEKPDQINSVVLAKKQNGQPPAVLNNEVAKVWRLEDLGLSLRPHNGFFSLESSEVILNNHLAQAAIQASGKLGFIQQPVLTYLANQIRLNQKTIPYSTVTAVKLPMDQRFGPMNILAGSIQDLKENEIVLNNWAANDLQASIGDTVHLSYYKVNDASQLLTEVRSFIVQAIISMDGIAGDRTLTPDFPGIQNVKHISEWSPPFPIDLGLIRKKDEDYWDQYGAAPKAFVSEEAGQKLWSSRFGKVTSIRFAPPAGTDPQSSIQAFGETLLHSLSPEQSGFTFQAVKEEGLKSAAGSTDFGLLFLGFSMFLIVSAALMVSLLYRLGVEARAAEIGVLLSVGFPQRKVFRLLLQEAALLSAIGSLVGLAVSLLYASLLIGGLRTWWLAAVGSPFLNLHVNALTLLIGFLASFAIMVLSVYRTIRKVIAVPTPLLFGKSSVALESSRPAKLSKWIAIGSASFAILLTLFAFVNQQANSPETFFAVGSLLLIAGLASFLSWLRSSNASSDSQKDLLSLYQMAARNNVRHASRSLLSVSLVCCACFVIIAVGANRKNVSGEDLRLNSGTGGFRLMAQSEVPLIQDLNSEKDREKLGIAGAEFRNSKIISYRLLPGDDASCLNLYRPQQPTILGVPAAQINRGGFDFRSTISKTENPWTLLNQNIDTDVVPTIGDYNSVQWILHSGLGKELPMKAENGTSMKLRIVGLLNSSIFQSELLISEENFKRYFPSRAGYSYFLIETPSENAARVGSALETSLSRLGFDVVGTSERLESYLAVENTYLTTFQTLGAFGLLLGTLGLGIVLIRNILERKGELATLRAFGFPKSRVAFLILAENSFLLLCGILIGLVSAIVAVLPQIIQNANQLPWLSLSLTLVAVIACGTIAGAVASSAVLRLPLLPALKAE